ncbi:hypothetical protein [Dysgonomonas sp.]
MKKTIWLTYDLGVGGDYANFYSWLDDNKATECGNNVAYLQIDIPNANSDNDVVQTVKNSLKSKIKFEATSRVYLIRAKIEDGKTKMAGSFIIGKRKANPWEGYGTASDETIDE